MTATTLLLSGLILAVGCSAAGESDDLGSATTNGDGGGSSSGSALPPSISSSTSSSSGGMDSGKIDSGKKEAGVDAGPPPPVPGEPCTTIDEIKEKPCGACGKQTTICLAQDDGGSPTWGDYSTCTGEVSGGCVPGTVEEVPCGNCGKLTQTCNKYCAWTKTTCSGQPTNSCSPGALDLLATCANVAQYRPRTCGDMCTWNASTACAAPPTQIDIVASPGGTTYTIATLAGTHTRLTGTCPSATISTTASHKNVPFVYVQVRNPLAKAAKVTIYNSQAPGGGNVNTVLASYARATAPSTSGERQACDKGVATSGDTSLTGNSSFAALYDSFVDNRVTIPANTTYTIYIAAETNAPANVGSVKLNVRTDELL